MQCMHERSCMQAGARSGVAAVQVRCVVAITCPVHLCAYERMRGQGVVALRCVVAIACPEPKP